MKFQEWDRRHRASAESAPDERLIEAVDNLPPGRALDIACGTGRNAIWLAEQGWKVTAVDGSFAALEILHERSLARGARLTQIHADLELGEYTIEPGAWELIVVSLYLQRDLFEPIKAGLVPGGIAVVIVLREVPGQKPGRFRVHPGELAGYFQGWKIHHSRESGDFAEIVAEKPIQPPMNADERR